MLGVGYGVWISNASERFGQYEAYLVLHLAPDKHFLDYLDPADINFNQVNRMSTALVLTQSAMVGWERCQEKRAIRTGLSV